MSLLKQRKVASTPAGAKPIRKSTRNFIKENIESIRAYQKNGQLKLKLSNSYNDANSLKTGNNSQQIKKSNPRNRTKVRKLNQNRV